MRLHFLFAFSIGATLSTCAHEWPIDEPRRDEVAAGVGEQNPSMTDFERAFPVRALRFDALRRVVLDYRVDGHAQLAECAVFEEAPLVLGVRRYGA